MNRRYIYLLLSLFSLMAACKKPKPGDPVAREASPDDSIQYDGYFFNLSIKNMVGDKEMVFKTSLDSGTTYYNHLGEPFKIRKYLYYISNIKLITTANDTVVLSPVYHLVNAANGTYNASFRVKKAIYKELIFLAGVDSLRNTTGIQTGALDPVWGMFWDWNTGYIMAMFEGDCTLTSTGIFMFHAGGFKGEHSVLSNIHIPFNTPIDMQHNDINFKLTADAQKWFDGQHLISLEEENIIESSGPIARILADNYSKMFVKYEID